LRKTSCNKGKKKQESKRLSSGDSKPLGASNFSACLKRQRGKKKRRKKGEKSKRGKTGGGADRTNNALILMWTGEGAPKAQGPARKRGGPLGGRMNGERGPPRRIEPRQAPFKACKAK